MVQVQHARWKRLVLLALLCVMLLTSTGTPFAVTGPVRAAVDIFASPVNAGCYLVKLDRCKIHVEPFTINVAPGEKLVHFQLQAIRAGGSPQVIYDFRPDVSLPIPTNNATTYSPTLVRKDFAATCSASYTVRLLGEGTVGPFSILGTTTQFTCPKGAYLQYMPSVRK